ncbi:cobalamin B12-binding domain protein [Sulfurifustis variabilis]|uniref:Cobalamin B12-binding domain protein n=1 Tax=Sulfurifustis variabilis TaxID=1675686 RepID=A0A1B4V492_9GAMM|nr:B12-binding domain-containing protein [Sulfurifustis variabilis]BAU48360.1 cobalamin B12-binding domain protein [Sulfurifustis variabilis]
MQLGDGTNLRDRRRDLAAAATDRLLSLHPDFRTLIRPDEKQECVDDLALHVLFLADAAALDSPEIFEEYVAWTKTLLDARGVPASRLHAHLAALADILPRRVASPLSDTAAACLRGVLEHFDDLPAGPDSFLDERRPLGPLARRFTHALLALRRDEGSRLISEALDAGTSVEDIYLDVFQPTLHEVGRLWQLNGISVAHEHYCTAAIQLLMGELHPRLIGPPRPPRRAVATCVTGELHELGLRMVTDFLDHAGWETHFVGASLPAKSVVDLLIETGSPVLCISVTFATHLMRAAELIGEARAEPACADVGIVVGGRAFSRSPFLWRRMGANAWARDAREAVAACEALIAQIQE